MRKSFCLTIASLFTTLLFAQPDTSANRGAHIFKTITQGVEMYQVDTTAPPHDKTTKAIMQLRDLKGGFNINEAIDFKIEEDRRKGELPANEGDKLAHFFNSGDGKRWLDNAVTWIYRKHFTYAELKQLVRFYKKGAGQKMAVAFPLIMLQSLKAAETIKNSYTGTSPVSK